MDFSSALLAVKAGAKISRKGWNGQGMYVALSPGHKDLEAEKIWSPVLRADAEQNGGTTSFLPYLMFRTVQGDFVPWVASQTDLLANDWTGEQTGDAPVSDAEGLARRFHKVYEELAPSHGYETREASRKPWADVPENNKSLMIAVCARIMETLDLTKLKQYARELAELEAQGVDSWDGYGPAMRRAHGEED